jgi:hypothetical protein
MDVDPTGRIWRGEVDAVAAHSLRKTLMEALASQPIAVFRSKGRRLGRGLPLHGIDYLRWQSLKCVGRTDAQHFIDARGSVRRPKIALEPGLVTLPNRPLRILESGTDIR